jgi:hypothetical protein
MADSAVPAYSRTQRAIDRAILWSLSRLLAAVLAFVSFIRRRPSRGSSPC